MSDPLYEPEDLVVLDPGQIAGHKSRKSGLMVRCLRCGKGVSARTAHLVSKDGTDRYCCPACWDERLR